jgi:hypothetical protein
MPCLALHVIQKEDAFCGPCPLFVVCFRPKTLPPNLATRRSHGVERNYDVMRVLALARVTYITLHTGPRYVICVCWKVLVAEARLESENRTS